MEIDNDVNLESPMSTQYVDWNKLPPEERLKKINKSRNYLRYKLIKGLRIESYHPLLTPEEKIFIQAMNDNRQAIELAKYGLLRSFYENCPKVGSTLVRKEKKIPKPLHDIIGDVTII